MLYFTPKLVLKSFLNRDPSAYNRDAKTILDCAISPP